MKCKNCKNLINGWCEKKLDSPAPDEQRKCGDYEVKTNYDRIKQMSIEEMAECSIPFFNCPYDTPYVGCDMGIEMSFTTEELNIVIDLCKHMVGLDRKRPYHRHGKAFYKPYRNFYGVMATGIDVLDRLTKLHIVDVEKDEKYSWYSLTDSGLKWLGRQLNIIIKPETK